MNIIPVWPWIEVEYMGSGKVKVFAFMPEEFRFRTIDDNNITNTNMADEFKYNAALYTILNEHKPMVELEITHNELLEIILDYNAHQGGLIGLTKKHGFKFKEEK